MKGATMKRTRKLSLVDSPAEAPEASATPHDRKLAAAKQYLGERWCHHAKFAKSKLNIGLLDRWKASMSPSRVTVTSKEKR